MSPTHGSTATRPPASPPDQGNQLLIRAAGGDRAAFKRLYDLYQATVFAICVNILRDQDRASDTFQDAFVKIWANASRYDPSKGDAIAWMVTLTRRCALDHVRRLARQPVVNSDEIEATLASSDLPDANVSTAALRTCLKTLDPHHRRAIVLAFTYGLTHRELATKLARPLGTVKSWLRRGMGHLKQCLAG